MRKSKKNLPIADQAPNYIKACEELQQTHLVIEEMQKKIMQCRIMVDKVKEPKLIQSFQQKEQQLLKDVEKEKTLLHAKIAYYTKGFREHASTQEYQQWLIPIADSKTNQAPYYLTPEILSGLQWNAAQSYQQMGNAKNLVYWLERSSDQGNLNASRTVALNYFSKSSSDFYDAKKATRHLEYLISYKVASPTEIYICALLYLQFGQTQKMLMYLHKAAELDDSHACYYLGNAYLYAKYGLRRDSSKALIYFQQSKLPLAKLELAGMYLYGTGIKVNTTKAFQISQKLIDSGELIGHRISGEYYSTVEEAEDIKQALSHYVKYMAFLQATPDFPDNDRNSSERQCIALRIANLNLEQYFFHRPKQPAFIAGAKKYCQMALLQGSEEAALLLLVIEKGPSHDLNRFLADYLVKTKGNQINSEIGAIKRNTKLPILKRVDQLLKLGHAQEELSLSTYSELMKSLGQLVVDLGASRIEFYCYYTQVEQLILDLNKRFFSLTAIKYTIIPTDTIQMVLNLLTGLRKLYISPEVGFINQCLDYCLHLLLNVVGKLPLSQKLTLITEIAHFGTPTALLTKYHFVDLLKLLIEETSSIQTHCQVLHKMALLHIAEKKPLFSDSIINVASQMAEKIGEDINKSDLLLSPRDQQSIVTARNYFLTTLKQNCPKKLRQLDVKVSIDAKKVIAGNNASVHISKTQRLLYQQVKNYFPTARLEVDVDGKPRDIVVKRGPKEKCLIFDFHGPTHLFHTIDHKIIETPKSRLNAHGLDKEYHYFAIYYNQKNLPPLKLNPTFPDRSWYDFFANLPLSDGGKLGSIMPDYSSYSFEKCPLYTLFTYLKPEEIAQAQSVCQEWLKKSINKH